MKERILQTLAALASHRPVFHSEADLQHAFAVQLKETHPHFDIRLEVPFNLSGKRASIDLVIRDGSKTVFVELKYKTRMLSHTHGNEVFALKNQGARDHGAYDILKDIQRLEAFVASTPDSEGFSVVLSNDPGYWSPPQRTAPTLDAEFKLAEGRVLTGILKWHPSAGFGSIKDRQDPIVLQGSYPVQWWNFASLPGNDEAFRGVSFHITSTLAGTATIKPVASSEASTPPRSPSQAVLDTQPKPPSAQSHSESKREPNWKLVLQTVERLGGCAELSRIQIRFAQDCPDRKVINVRHELVLMSVNHPKRVHYGQAKKPRRSDSGHPVDSLFVTPSGQYELYAPTKHGVWEIYSDHSGKPNVRRVSN